MIEQGKTYTYDELRGIIDETTTIVINELNKKIENIEEANGMQGAMFMMQNMLVLSTFIGKLFEKEEK